MSALEQEDWGDHGGHWSDGSNADVVSESSALLGLPRRRFVRYVSRGRVGRGRAAGDRVDGGAMAEPPSAALIIEAVRRVAPSLFDRLRHGFAIQELQALLY